MPSSPAEAQIKQAENRYTPEGRKKASEGKYLFSNSCVCARSSVAQPASEQYSRFPLPHDGLAPADGREIWAGQKRNPKRREQHHFTVGALSSNKRITLLILGWSSFAGPGSNNRRVVITVVGWSIEGITK